MRRIIRHRLSPGMRSAETARAAADSMRRALCALGALAAICLLAPGVAAASTYCVGTSGADCSATYPATGAALQSAIDDADINLDIGGTPDTVRIGAGTFSRAGGFKTAGGDLSIVGLGPETVLTGTGVANEIVLNLKLGGSPAASASKLRVDLLGGSASGIEGFQRVSDVHVGGPGTALDAAVRLPPGGRLSRALIDPAKIYSPAGRGIAASSGVVEDTVIRVRKDPSAYSAFGIALGSADATTSEMILRHVTIVGEGTQGSTGVLAQALRSNTAVTTLNVHLRDAVLHGLDVPLQRSGDSKDAAPACPPPCFDGVANIDYRYSSLDAGKDTASGPGATTAGAGNLADPDPLFADDLSLRSGSPLIDMGDPAGPEAGDSPTDAAGSQRIMGGRRDIGAFEFDPSAAPGPGPGGANPGPGSSDRGGASLAFGSKTLVTLKLAAGRIPAKGPVGFRVSNANGFAITGRLSGKTTKRVSVSRKRRIRLKAKSFSVGAHAKKTVKLKLPKALRKLLKRQHRLSLRLTAKVKDPTGNTRTVKKTVKPKLKKKRKRTR
jgi:hypothetical protein